MSTSRIHREDSSRCCEGSSHLSLLFCSGRKEDVKEADTEKEAAMEAELRAARERAVVPLEARMTQFKEMLLERGVSHSLSLRNLVFCLRKRFFGM